MGNRENNSSAIQTRSSQPLLSNDQLSISKYSTHSELLINDCKVAESLLKISKIVNDSDDYRLSSNVSFSNLSQSIENVGISGSTSQRYNRKAKSLQLLCSNFLSLFLHKPYNSRIELDKSAYLLQVERRRIYDIVNILEAIKVVEKRDKNIYCWKFDKKIWSLELKKLRDNFIKRFKSQKLKSDEYMNLIGLSTIAIHNSSNGADVSMKEKFENSFINKIHTKYWKSWNNETITEAMCKAFKPLQFSGNRIKYSNDNYMTLSNEQQQLLLSSYSSTQRNYKKQQSLCSLAILFFELFIANDQRLLSLDDIAKWILRENYLENPLVLQREFKSKVRRLYDVANVFVALKLIEKVNIIETRKSAFRWCGNEFLKLETCCSDDIFTRESLTRPIRKTANENSAQHGSEDALDVQADETFHSNLIQMNFDTGEENNVLSTQKSFDTQCLSEMKSLPSAVDFSFKSVSCVRYDFATKLNCLTNLNSIEKTNSLGYISVSIENESMNTESDSVLPNLPIDFSNDNPNEFINSFSLVYNNLNFKRRKLSDMASKITHAWITANN